MRALLCCCLLICALFLGHNVFANAECQGQFGQEATDYDDDPYCGPKCDACKGRCHGQYNMCMVGCSFAMDKDECLQVCYGLYESCESGCFGKD